jgi:hypothetical protein
MANMMLAPDATLTVALWPVLAVNVKQTVLSGGAAPRTVAVFVLAPSWIFVHPSGVSAGAGAAATAIEGGPDDAADRVAGA